MHFIMAIKQLFFFFSILCMKMHVCKIVFNRVKNVRTAYTSAFKNVVTCSFLLQKWFSYLF